MPRERVTEEQRVADLRQAAADSKNLASAVHHVKDGEGHEIPQHTFSDAERAAFIQASAIYEVGAALLEQLVKLTRATRD